MEERERRLIAESLSGKADAFGELIAPYQDRLYNALFRLTGHAEDAAELFQEAMVRVFRGLGSYQGDSSFYTWLYRIVLNVAFTHRRRQRAPMISMESAGVSGKLDFAQTDESAEPGREVERGETRGIIERSLAQVPESYRVVLILKDIDGLKYEEIAEILEVPVGTVRSRLHRARCEMRDRLQPFWTREQSKAVEFRDRTSRSPSISGGTYISRQDALRLRVRFGPSGERAGCSWIGSSHRICPAI